MERGKTRAENIKRIAKELHISMRDITDHIEQLLNLLSFSSQFIEDTKVIGKDMAEEAREFFREYKDDLGRLYDEVVEKVRQIVKS
ncbi:hypothetical protein AVEN_5106-1 [Araneus ventricosus]|uniref:Uncharacterized protein n=1 Tax=Araneus ventricosus TaxID=182803 RepID=A0A4Y2GK43_ARAVE|nr:hypothetical protein AVEN_5106-1 [Araneus ventricosus]